MLKRILKLSGQREGALLGDNAADVVRQAAVCVGHEPGALEDNYLGALVETAKARGGSGPSGDTAYYNYFLTHGHYLHIC